MDKRSRQGDGQARGRKGLWKGQPGEGSARRRYSHFHVLEFPTAGPVQFFFFSNMQNVFGQMLVWDVNNGYYSAQEVGRSSRYHMTLFNGARQGKGLFRESVALCQNESCFKCTSLHYFSQSLPHNRHTCYIHTQRYLAIILNSENTIACCCFQNDDVGYATVNIEILSRRWLLTTACFAANKPLGSVCIVSVLSCTR